MDSETYTLTHDAENRLVDVSGAADVSFVYDGDGRMVIKEEADGSRTLYIGNYLEIEIPSQGTPTPTPTATASQTPTSTVTPTPTASPTITQTPTPTATGNPTSTPAPTATTIHTPTSTTTATQTPTVTNTPAVTHTPTPTATSSGNLIFTDGFESGDFSAWDSSATDGGDLSVTTGAAMVGTYGMSAVIDDNNAIYVTDETPNGETEYVVRFYFDPNSISMSNNDNHTIFFAYKGTIQPAMRVELRYYSGNYQVRAQARKDSLFVNTSYYTITDDEHYIEVAWSAATSPGANNGELTLYVDGIQKESITNIDNDTIYIDRVQLGAVTEVDNGTRGTYYFDAFESRSSGYIGPVAAIPGMQVAIVEPADGALASISYWLLNLLQEIFEWVVTFFQPGSALASEVQVVAAQALPVKIFEESIPTGQVWKTYYYAGSQRVAMRVNDGETNEVYYLFSDHLGSTSITTESEGNLYAELRYTAWGEVRYSSGQTPTDYTYTGQRSEVSNFGLMYYNARWYEPGLGRFAEADIIVPNNKPQNFDRFSYSLNNPIKYSDPSGHASRPTCQIYTDDGNCAKWSNGMVWGIPYFYRSPISREHLIGVHWFGATQRAYDLWKGGDDIYNYCQDMHCGLDLLADYGSPVYAGVYGKVIIANSHAENNPRKYEGPWKIQIEVGDYVVTYGHTDGYPLVIKGQYVTPDTIIGGVGNMGGNEGSGEIDHIHLEVRGPGGWAGDSINPLIFMSPAAKTMIVDAAKTQEIEVEMSKFTDGTGVYNYPPPGGLMPLIIKRTSVLSQWR